MSDFLGPKAVTLAGLDAATAAKVNTPGSATATALSATYVQPAALIPKLDKTEAAATYARPGGNTIVLAGDSRIAQELTGTPADATYSNTHAGAFNYANIEMRQRFHILNNAGINGNTIQQLIDRYQTDVLAYQPQNVLLGIGINSISAGLDAPTVKGQITQLFDLNTSAGAHSIILTINPRNANTSGQNLVLADVNRWLLGLGRRDVTVIDVTTPVVADTGMVWKTGYTLSADGLHQNRAAAVKMGKRIADALRPLYPPRSVLPLYEGDPLNLCPNPFMTGTTNATGLSPFVSSGTFVTSLVAATDGLPGNWQQIAATDAGTPTDVSLQKTCNLTADVVIGNTISCSMEIEFPALTALGTFNVTLQAMDASSAVLKSVIGFTNRTGDGATWDLADFIGRNGAVVVRTPDLLLPPTCTKVKLTLNCLQLVGTIKYRRINIGKIV